MGSRQGSPLAWKAEGICIALLPHSQQRCHGLEFPSHLHSSEVPDIPREERAGRTYCQLSQIWHGDLLETPQLD